MTTPVIPQTYAQWRHCIEVDCGIPLTAAFIDEWLAALSEFSDEEARHFEQHYSDEHRHRVRRWFEQARKALA